MKTFIKMPLTKDTVLYFLPKLDILKNILSNDLILHINDIFTRIGVYNDNDIIKQLTMITYNTPNIVLYFKLINKPRYNLYELYVNMTLNITKKLDLDGFSFNATLYDIYNSTFNDTKTYFEDKYPLQDLYNVIYLFTSLT